MLTGKPLSNSSVENETAVSIVRVTFSKSLIDGSQVEVDSIVQVDSTVSFTGRQHRVGRTLLPK